MLARNAVRRLAARAACLAALGALFAAHASAAAAPAPIDPRSVVPLLRVGDVAALESRLDALRAARARTREGWLTLPGALAAAGFAAASDPGIGERLAAWIAQRPDSWYAAMVDGWRHLANRSRLIGTEASFTPIFVPDQRDPEVLARAGDAFARAAALAPRSPEPAAGRIAVAILQRAPIEERVALLETGCAVDPVCESARVILLTGLEPHLGGSRELLLWFGRTSAAAHPDDVRLGLLPAFAHRKVALTMPSNEAYVRLPGVYEEIEAAYERHLEVYPGAVLHRNEYARVSVWAGRQAIARRQFELLGDQYAADAWKYRFERFREARAWAMATSPGAGAEAAAP